jgi:hypothetical protein
VTRLNRRYAILKRMDMPGYAMNLRSRLGILDEMRRLKRETGYEKVRRRSISLSGIGAQSTKVVKNLTNQARDPNRPSPPRARAVDGQLVTRVKVRRRTVLTRLLSTRSRGIVRARNMCSRKRVHIGGSASKKRRSHSHLLCVGIHGSQVLTWTTTFRSLA